MLNVAIIEDSNADYKELEKNLLQYSQQTGRVFNIERFKEAESFLNFYKSKYDIVFFDIELLGINGMKAAHKLREIDERIVIIFVTNLKQFACEGYSVDAMDFIVKPIMYARIAAVLNRVFSRLEPDNKDDEIVLRGGDGLKRIVKSKILYIETERHYLTFHTSEHSFSVYGTMKKIKEQFSDKEFALCSSSFLVNLRYVKAIDGDTVVVMSDKLKISRPKRKGFMDALNAYLGEH